MRVLLLARLWSSESSVYAVVGNGGRLYKMAMGMAENLKGVVGLTLLCDGCGHYLTGIGHSNRKCWCYTPGFLFDYMYMLYHCSLPCVTAVQVPIVPRSLVAALLWRR